MYSSKQTCTPSTTQVNTVASNTIRLSDARNTYNRESGRVSGVSTQSAPMRFPDYSKANPYEIPASKR
jgi:hypothetical protein